MSSFKIGDPIIVTPGYRGVHITNGMRGKVIRIRSYLKDVLVRLDNFNEGHGKNGDEWYLADYMISLDEVSIRKKILSFYESR